MSDRIASVVKFLQWASFVIGLAIAALGGGGSAVQYKLAPQAFGDAAAADTITFYTLSGIATAIIGPLVGLIFKVTWGKLFSGKAKAIAQYAAAVCAQNTLQKYLAIQPEEVAKVNSLTDPIGKVFGEAVKAAEAPVQGAK